MFLKKMLAFAAISLLPGCTLQTSISATDVCKVWQPVTWSSKDTPETVTEVKVSNARRAAWCGEAKKGRL